MFDFVSHEICSKGMASIHQNVPSITGWFTGRRATCPAVAPLATCTRNGRNPSARRYDCDPFGNQPLIRRRVSSISAGGMFEAAATDSGGHLGQRDTPPSLTSSPSPYAAEGVALRFRQPERGPHDINRDYIRSTTPQQLSPRPASAEVMPVLQQQYRQPQPLRHHDPKTIVVSPFSQRPGSAAGVERLAPLAHGPVGGSDSSSLRQPHPTAEPHSELGCARFGLCSGCSLQDGLAAPPLYSEAKGFFQQLGLAEVPAVMQASHGWRCRAKLAVRGPAGRPLIGLFKEGSHDCVDIVGPAVLPPCSTAPARADTGRRWGGRSGGGVMPVAGPDRSRDSNGGGLSWMVGDEALSCRAQHPRINQAAVLIKELVTQLRIPPYNEPAPAKARVGTAAATANHRPPSARASRRRKGHLQGQGTDGHPGGLTRVETAPSSRAEGILRYLQLTAVPSQPGNRAEEDPDAGVQVVLVLNLPPDCELNDPRVASVMQLCRTLWRLTGPGGPMVPTADSPPPPLLQPTPPRTPLVHSIWLNFQPDARRNAILGEGWCHVAGPAAAWQDFGGVAACVGPGSFVQANYGAMQLVLEEIASMVPCESRVTELHAGIGVIGLSLAARRRLAALRCVEVNPAAAEPFRASLELLRDRQQLPTVVEYLTAEAGSDPDHFLADCDVLVVDPPRKGLGQSLLEALTQPSKTLGSMELVAAAAQPGPGGARETSTTAKRVLPSRLVYLSCGFRALQGDLAVLLAGGWRLRSATAYMFFPGTNSLETLVLLTREVNEDGDGDGDEG